MSEELIFEFESNSEIIRERYDLAVSRIKELKNESLGNDVFDDYFQKVRSFIEMMDETYNWVLDGGLNKDSLEDLQSRNKALYEDILPENFANIDAIVNLVKKLTN